MQYINLFLRSKARQLETFEDAKLHDIFDFVAGTSTGGLIAIMLGKLGMPVEDCISAYRDFSRQIFARKHLRGRITFGLAHAMYSGHRLDNCTQDLIRKKKFEATIPMTSPQESDKIAWSVEYGFLHREDSADLLIAQSSAESSANRQDTLS